jgi:pimeloyl-ACP methyl ester carboxylesterase
MKPTSIFKKLKTFKERKSKMKLTSILLCLLLAACSSFKTEKKQPDTFAKLGTSKTIVFIHGLYVTPMCWDGWKSEFEAKGYKTFAPAYPYVDADAATMRKRHPDAKLTSLHLAQVLQHYRDFIQALPEKPILIGHSMGGLISQILLNEGLVAGAIVVDSGPPYGIISKLTSAQHGFRFIQSAWPVISPFASDNDPIFMDEEMFKTSFANGLEESKFSSEYAKHIIPSSRKLPRGALTEESKIDYSKKRGPLLLISGEDDRIIPPSVSRANYNEYEKEAGLTEYKEFAGKSHYIIAEKGWQDVVTFSQNWIEKNR